jgi:hypothetical protein
MRITRDILLNQARENAAKLALKDRGVICIYLAGSLLREDPLIGGTTDIDLIVVHDRPVDTPREIIRLSADINLDLAHYEKEAFEPSRKLRTNAWIGGGLESVPLVLYDVLRWYDFTRAGATSQFWRPENTAARARSFIVPARKTWSDIQEDAIPQGIKRVTAYLNALRDAANGIASLTGSPLPVRRLLMDLPMRALKVSLPNFGGDFVQLFTSSEVSDERFAEWMAAYPSIFEEGKEIKDYPVNLRPFRRAYYEKALQSIYPDHPAAAIWIMLHTWTKAAAYLPKTSQAYKDWLSLCRQLELDTRNLPARLEAFDQLLDTAEEAADRLQG